MTTEKALEWLLFERKAFADRRAAFIREVEKDAACALASSKCDAFMRDAAFHEQVVNACTLLDDLSSYINDLCERVMDDASEVHMSTSPSHNAMYRHRIAARVRMIKLLTRFSK